MTDNSQPPQKRTLAIRIGGLALAFIITMCVAPRVLTAVAGPSNKWSGSLGIVVYIIPGLVAALWVLFSIIAAGIFIRSGSSLVSVARCIGIGFVLAIIGTIVTLAIYDIPPYFGP